MIGIVRAIVLLTVLAVTTGDDELPDGYEIVNPFVCKPGEHFKLDCNHCTCSSDPGAIGMCTLMACNLGPDECIPGSYFPIKDSLCSCPDSGNKWDSDCFSKKTSSSCNR